MKHLPSRLLPLLALMAFEASAAAAPANPDTVSGIATFEYRPDALPWTPDRFVRVRNRHDAAIKVHPPVLEPVYREVEGNQGLYPYQWAYAVRRHGGGSPRIIGYAWGGDTLSLAAGDSLDIGMFQIGPMAVAKRSAAPPPLQAKLGDTVNAQASIRFGSDSLRFVLKTEIAPFIMAMMPNPAWSLVGNRDTVLGMETRHWDPNREWKRENYIRVRNHGPRALVVDSIRFPADSVMHPGSTFAGPMDKLFAVRTYAGGVRITAIWGGDLNRFPVTLAFGDSADFGLFQIGSIGLLVKQSAAARRYRIGETLVAPLALYAGSDSLRFILKAKVVEATAGSSLAPPARRMRGYGGGVLSFSADGRLRGDGDFPAAALFRGPAAGTASRPR